MELCGESYKGQRRGEMSFRMEGEGRYTFENGDVYIGAFKDGMFHGRGVLIFANNGGRFEGEWKNGISHRGDYVFNDGLLFREKDWSYATAPDRRLHIEQTKGLKGPNL